MASDEQIYCNCIQAVRDHVNIAQTIVAERITTARADPDQELIAVQLRKALEGIAFATLSANREPYAATQERFATDWRARRMLRTIEKLNPAFYPIPLRPPERSGFTGILNYEMEEDGYLTRPEFENLYDLCSRILHSRNPYEPGAWKSDTHFTAMEWIRRIQMLLRLHSVQPSDTEGRWIVEVCGDGPVHLVAALHESSLLLKPDAKPPAPIGNDKVSLS
jgi:hypothetical protein